MALPMLPLVAYPQLALLCWSTPGAVHISPEHAWGLYERGWHHIDVQALTGPERVLIRDLAQRYGDGVAPFDRPPITPELHASVLAIFDLNLLARLDTVPTPVDGLTTEAHFVCRSREGFRELRELASETLEPLLLHPVEQIGRVLRNGHGLRATLRIQGAVVPVAFNMRVMEA